jgi:pimeloyl-ACP methyl ester carboxylesterase
VDVLGSVAPMGGVEQWVDAVDRCATRLEQGGVDVTAFGESSMAADVLDLVDALGVSSWNIGSWGTTGRVALEVLRHDPAGLRAVFLDAPELPGDDTLGAAAARTAQALRRVLDACAADPECRALPHTLADVDRIASALDSEPVDVTIQVEGLPVAVAVDGELLVRLLRHMLANNASHSQVFTADAVPAALAAAETRDEASLALLVEPMGASKAYCEGYLIYCPAHQLTTLGAYLSTVCSRAGGPSGEDDLPEAVRRTFTEDPYWLACDRWPVEAEDAPDKQIESDVPVLLLTGGWDPFVDVDPDGWRTALGGLSRLTAVQVPGWGHNVLGSGDCAQSMRNSFVADPEQPVDTSCLAKLPTAPAFLQHL